VGENDGIDVGRREGDEDGNILGVAVGGVNEHSFPSKIRNGPI